MAIKRVGFLKFSNMRGMTNEKLIILYLLHMYRTRLVDGEAFIVPICDIRRTLKDIGMIIKVPEVVEMCNALGFKSVATHESRNNILLESKKQFKAAAMKAGFSASFCSSAVDFMENLCIIYCPSEMMEITDEKLQQMHGSI